MSALPTPESDDTGRLSEHERAVLDDIAGHENASDPGFVAALGAPPRAAGTQEDPGPLVPAHHRDRVIQSAVLGGLVALVLPAAWLVAVVLTVLLLVVPLVLTVHALRRGRFGPATAAGPRDEP